MQALFTLVGWVIDRLSRTTPTRFFASLMRLH
nr:MAG TPA: hypothetical protein [Caudoviricetes sp.]